MLQDLRPPLGAHIPEELQDLMSNCWHPYPEVRPTFDEVTNELERIKRAIRLDMTVDPKTPYREALSHKLKTQKSRNNGLISGAI